MSSAPTQLPFRGVLVTGGTGFVGRHLIPVLRKALAHDSRIVVGGRCATSDAIALDLNDAALVARTVAELAPDLVVHLAAQASVGLSAHAAAETWRSNLSGSLVLAEAVARHAPEATFFFTSTVEVYGLTFNDGVASEASPLRPQSSYGRSKAAAEAMLADVLPAGARLIVSRTSNHSGPGQSDAFVIPSFAMQIAAGENGLQDRISVGNLDARRDFLDVTDVVAAYIELLRASGRMPLRSVVNVATGNSVPVREVLEGLLALSTRPVPIHHDPARARPSEVPVAEIDNAALRALGWRPKIPLEGTLSSVLDYERRRLAHVNETPAA